MRRLPPHKVIKLINFDLHGLTSDRTLEPELDKDGDSDDESESDAEENELDTENYGLYGPLSPLSALSSDDGMDEHQDRGAASNHSVTNVSTANVSTANVSTANVSTANVSTANVSAANVSTPNVSSTSPPAPKPRRVKTPQEKEKRKRYQQKYRQEGRDMARQAKKLAKLQKKIMDKAEKINVELCATNVLEKTKAGFTGVNRGQSSDLLDKNKWVNIPRSNDPNAPTTVLVDKHGRIFAIRGTPSGTQTPENLKEGLLKAMLELGKRKRNPPPPPDPSVSPDNNNVAEGEKKKKNNTFKRGYFKTMAMGISYGGGPKKPAALKSIRNRVAVDKYLTNQYVHHWTHHINNFFKMWFPCLHQYYEENMFKLEASHNMVRFFPGLPFMASSLNLGPQTLAVQHKDFKNLAFGQCAIIVLGDFDHKKGGKLRLKEAGVELEVAPGDIVFIPSAAITHFNTGLQPDETRYSLTFYTAGQLFRWVHDNCQPVKSLTKEEKAKTESDGEENWRKGWDMYRNINELS